MESILFAVGCVSHRALCPQTSDPSFVANALTMVLLAALALSFGVQDFIEGSVIAAVIVLNTLSVWLVATSLRFH